MNLRRGHFFHHASYNFLNTEIVLKWINPCEIERNGFLVQMLAKPIPRRTRRFSVEETVSDATCEDGGGSRNIQLIFDTDDIDANSPDAVPDQLKVAISPELWNSYSPVRRESFKMMFTNPNSFFYRNRPPGDPQKCGPFTAEEEAQFLERVRYFREELGIGKGSWGLFAVPFRGRLGYQCSNFYRQMVQDGKLSDESCEVTQEGKTRGVKGDKKVVSKEAHDRLVKEAFAFIRKCIEESGEVQMPVTIGKDGERHARRIRKKADAAEETAGQEIVVGMRTGHKSRLARVGRDDDEVQEESEEVQEEDAVVLRYARDSITGKPMMWPYLDPRTGVVLDISTWKDIFSGRIPNTASTQAKDVSEILLMNKRTFNKYWMDVTNVFF